MTEFSDQYLRGINGSLVMYFDLFDSSCVNVDLPFSRTRPFSIGEGFNNSGTSIC